MDIAILWLGLLMALFGLAARMEWGAIRNRINGANGLVILVAGVLGVFSVPIGFALIWYRSDALNAFKMTASVALIAGLLWWGLLHWLDRAAQARKGS